MANLGKDYYLDEQGLQTLINELETNLVALEYSSSATYAVGDYCVHDNKMYRCTTAITTAESWDSTHWALVIIGDEIKSKTQVNSDWSSNSGVSQILNKPTLGTASAKDVATSGDASTTQVVMGNDSRLTDSRTPTSHSHGNIANGGTISSSAVTLASGDYLLVSDTSASGKIERGIELGSSTTTFLNNKGGWSTPVGTTYTGTGLISVDASTHVISTTATDNIGTVTQVKVGSTAYDPTSGVVSLPAYPTVNNATLTIQKNGTTVKTFTANASSNVTANITVPTSASDVGALPDTTKYALSGSVGGDALNSAKVNNLTVETAVPSGAVFTDTWIALTGATSSANGKVGYINAAPPKDGYNTKFFRADGTWQVPVGTTYANGTGITIGTGNAINHSNSVTAQTTQKVYPIKIDAQGHISAYGTSPTTLSGYGITDAKIASGVITLGSNTITPLTASSTLDATKLSGTIPSGCYTNTTYTFAGGTNKITVTPSGGTAQDVTITPSISNNITGSGTSGYLTKFNGTNTITNGPQLGSSTTTYLRNDGTWATPTDTKVTQSVLSSTATRWRKLVLGYSDSTSAGASASDVTNITYVDNALEYNPDSETLNTTNLAASNTVLLSQSEGTSGGISLFSTTNRVNDYGIAMRKTGTDTGQLGKHGYVQGDWATYFNMLNGASDYRGWIFRSSTNRASIDVRGNAVFNGSVTIGGNTTNTSGCRLTYNSTTKSCDFVFA